MDSALTRIPSLLARQRRLRAAAGTLRVLWILIGGHLILLAGLGALSLRFPLSPVCLSLMGWSYLLYLALPVAYAILWSARSNASEAVARELDRANPDAPDPFRTVLSLENHGEATLRDLDHLFAGFMPRLALPRPRIFPVPHRIALAFSLSACVAAALLTGRPGEFLRRATLPWVVLDRLPTLRFDLAESSRVLGVGDTLRIAGRARNLMPGQAIYAYVKTAAGVARFPLSIDTGQGFDFTFGPAASDFSLYFAGDNGRSPSQRFTVVSPPILASIQAVLTPPGYTRLRADTLPPGLLRFPVLPGTRVTWSVASDRDLKRLGWRFASVDPDSRSSRTSASSGSGEDTLGPGRSFRIDKEIRRPLDYSFWLEDAQGIRSRPSQPARVDLIPDLAPEVDLVAPGGDTVLDRDARINLAFRVKDDFGLTSLKLVYRIFSGVKVRTEGQRDGRDWLKSARSGLVEAEWDLKSLDLRADDIVEFHLAAVDNDTVNGPKTGRSATRSLRMSTIQEVLAATRQKEQSAVSNLKSALQREKQLERKLERERQAPREEGPPMLADYEINRIMVEDPREHQRRAEAALAQISRSLERQSREDAGKSGNEKSGDKSAEAKSGREMSQVQTAVKELQDFLKKSEPSLPRGNQGMLPTDERKQNLDDLLKSQRDQAAKLEALRQKLEKSPTGMAPVEQAKNEVDYLAKSLERNLQNQSDLQKLLQDQAAQAKAKSDMMDQAIQEQMRMAEDMKSANDDLKKSMDQGAKNGLLSPELMEKMKKVQELLREVLPDSLQKLMESKLAGQEVNEQELKEKLKEMLEKQAELAENLNRALAMLEQLKDRKRMQELKSMLEDLQDREQALAKELQAGRTGAPQDADQKSIQQDAQKALADFAAQAAVRKDLQEVGKKLQTAPVQKDMQDVRQALAAAKGKSGNPQSSAAASASKSAGAAADKLGAMGEMLGEAMAGMESSVDLAEAQDLLQESLSLSRLQLLIRSGSARRQAEGWESDEAALYGSVAQTAQWLNERVKALAAKVPFLGQALTTESRSLSATAREAARQYTWDLGEKSLRHNQNLSRELLKLLKMAQNSGQGGGSGSGSGSPGSSGKGGNGQGGDLSGQLQGMSGKQMAINQATYQLLKAMMEGRQSGPGQGKGKQGKGGEKGAGGDGQSDGEGEGGKSGKGGKGDEGGEADDGEGSMGGMANKQGELGESLESLAEGMGEGGGSAQKIRSLADEARRLEEELRGGRLSPEELQRRQERFQSKLLEASNAMQERGQSESRQAETSRGQISESSAPTRAAEEARMLQLLREARRNAKGLRLSEGQRKYLDEYYESMLTR